MKNIILFFVFSIALVSSAFAEWTGGFSEGMYSNVVIKNITTGQIDTHPYFCIEASNGARACSIKNLSIWGPSYGTLYDMALYFYMTGESVRVYYDPGVWYDESFSTEITANALVGLSTCGTDKCFGPNRQIPSK